MLLLKRKLTACLLYRFCCSLSFNFLECAPVYLVVLLICFWCACMRIFEITKILHALPFDAKTAVCRFFVDCEIRLHCHLDLHFHSMDSVFKMHVHPCRSSFSAKKDCTPSSNAQSTFVKCPSAEPVQHPGLQEHTRASLRTNPRTGLAQDPWRKSIRTRSA